MMFIIWLLLIWINFFYWVLDRIIIVMPIRPLWLKEALIERITIKKSMWLEAVVSLQNIELKYLKIREKK